MLQIKQIIFTPPEKGTTDAMFYIFSHQVWHKIHVVKIHDVYWSCLSFLKETLSRNELCECQKMLFSLNLVNKLSFIFPCSVFLDYYMYFRGHEQIHSLKLFHINGGRDLSSDYIQNNVEVLFFSIYELVQ